VLKLKKRIDEVLDAVSGAQAAIENVQQDEDAMSLMYLSDLEADRAGYHAKVSALNPQH
jgi:hypothetical protein